MVTKEFIKEYKPYLVSLYKQKDSTLTTEDIEDLVQDTFEKVTLYQDYYLNDYDKDKKIPKDIRLKTWLKFVCVQVYDRFKRGAIQIDEIVKDYTKEEMLFDTSNFYTANKEEVNMFINLLPTSQKNVVYLKLVLGCSHEEIASRLYMSVPASTSNFKRGMDNLKKLINSDNPDKEVLQEAKILKPYGDKPFAGDWSWRYGESKEQRNSKPYVYTNEELVTFCTLHNLKYNIKERNL